MLDPQIITFPWEIHFPMKPMMNTLLFACFLHDRAKESAYLFSLLLFHVSLQRDGLVSVTINLLYWTFDPVKMRTRAISNIKRQNSLSCAKLPSSWHPEKNSPFSVFSQSPPDYQQTTFYSLSSTSTCALLFCLWVADQAFNITSFASILSNKTLLLYQFCP